MKHTPTPWKCTPPERGYFPTLLIPYKTPLGSGDDRSIIHSQNADADAAFIVRACNSHDALVFELSRARDMLKSRGIEITSINSALALAKGE